MESRYRIPEEISDPNKFMKILIKCGISTEQLKDRTWFVNQIGPTEYHCTGYHPVALRMDVIKNKIVIH